MPSHEEQKERARKEAEHHAEHSTVDGMKLPDRRMRSQAENTAQDLANDMKKEFGDKVEIETNTP